MMIGRHSYVVNQLVSFLVEEKGFSRRQLLFEPLYSTKGGVRNVRPDIVAIDPITNEPIVLFEIKTDRAGLSNGSYAAQLTTYTKIGEEGAIPAYLVVQSNVDHLAFFKLTDLNELEEIDPSHLPSYQDFMMAKLSPQLLDIEKKETKTKDTFKRLCFWLAGFVLVLLGADIFLESNCNYNFLTANRMTMVGVAIVLVIVPFVHKLKGL